MQAMLPLRTFHFLKLSIKKIKKRRKKQLFSFGLLTFEKEWCIYDIPYFRLYCFHWLNTIHKYVYGHKKICHCNMPQISGHADGTCLNSTKVSDEGNTCEPCVSNELCLNGVSLGPCPLGQMCDEPIRRETYCEDKQYSSEFYCRDGKILNRLLSRSLYPVLCLKP